MKELIRFVTEEERTFKLSHHFNLIYYGYDENSYYIQLKCNDRTVDSFNFKITFYEFEAKILLNDFVDLSSLHTVIPLIIKNEKEINSFVNEIDRITKVRIIKSISKVLK